MNERFQARLSIQLLERFGRLCFADPSLQARFVSALAATADRRNGRSIVIAATDDRAACVIHLLPLRLNARDIFEAEGVLLLGAEAANASIPGADLLRLLFDLTPAEARLVRNLVEGNALGDAAVLLGIADGTARTHLRNVFLKTGVRRQAELVRLLLGLGQPI
ncbi:helix-turn-helix transcriptional regulator [Sphingomonas glacialis]|uniref:Helix-turn-helix transcriptional regulator n=2 Tax=Sphingomonas glacialis TaxID=658225 RepID=A0A502FAQ8_9SPHN|nr:helix-turn-helix transcriptional regulator [Sphingomonas glacialis]